MCGVRQGVYGGGSAEVGALKSEKVLGHTCEGLERWRNEDRACFLGISEDGLIGSCDADSKIPIRYCPFCGAELGK